MRKILLILTIFMLSISIKPVKALEKAADTLKKNIVTSGDGLYVDSTIDGRYIYRGGNPNNYIKLGDDLYRIISVEKDGIIKVISQDSIRVMLWDEKNARYSTNNEDFCTDERGCKAWGSNTTTLDSNGNKVTQMPREVNGKLKNLPDKEASLNTYLNNYFYNSLSDDVKSLIVEKDWNIGPTAKNQMNLSESIREESAYKWRGKVALIDVIDYVKSSTNSACTSVGAYSSSNSSCYDNSNEHNYLYSNNDQWTVSSISSPNVTLVCYVSNSGYLYDQTYGDNESVRPAFYLSAKTILNGEGTKKSPYTLVTTNNDKKENDSNSNLSKLVDVILKKVVTSGDGVYVDKYNEGRYVYKGRNPNNYIKFNDELWRIMAIEKDGTFKIIRSNHLDSPTTADGRKLIYNDKNSVNYGTYCSLSVYSNGEPGGCNAWGKSDYYIGGYASGSDSKDTYGTVTENSFVNKYLNNDYYFKMSDDSKCKIVESNYYFGAVSSYYGGIGDSNYIDYIDKLSSEEKIQTWKGNVALPSVSDVLLASNDETTCGRISDINENYYSIVNGDKKNNNCIDGDSSGPYNEECYNSCTDTNWLMPSSKYKFSDYSYLLLNATMNYLSKIWGVTYRGLAQQSVSVLEDKQYNFTYNFRPVTHLRNDMEVLSGDGSENNPYELQCDECSGTKNNDSNESNLIVDVPPTSMFISAFIIGGFILITIICIIIYLKVFKKNIK